MSDSLVLGLQIVNEIDFGMHLFLMVTPVMLPAILNCEPVQIMLR
jgi:hypothetical protein